MLGVACGKRGATRVLELMRRVRTQLRGRAPRPVTTDEFASYATVLDLLSNDPPRPVPSGRGRKRPRPGPGRHRPALNYATVCKRRERERERERGRVAEVHTKVVFGSKAPVARALKRSGASRAVNTAFVERHHGTDRHRNARKGRRTYRFSKDWLMREAVTHFSYYTYNFCWPVRTLRKRVGRRRRYQPRTPAMSAGLTDHVWTLDEWLARPVPGLSS